jgi:hypothetical protein
MPGVQKPHWLPWHCSIACCTGCSGPFGAERCSMVTTWAASSEPVKVMQAVALS